MATSTQGPPGTLQAYEAGSLLPATLYQSWAWKTLARAEGATVSGILVQPAGPVTVTGSASTSRLARSRSPATVPAGFDAVVPFVTVDLARKLGGEGGAEEGVKVLSPEVL